MIALDKAGGRTMAALIHGRLLDPAAISRSANSGTDAAIMIGESATVKDGRAERSCVWRSPHRVASYIRVRSTASSIRNGLEARRWAENRDGLLALLASRLLDFDPGLRTRFDRMVEMRAGDMIGARADQTGGDERLALGLRQRHFDAVLVDDAERTIHDDSP
jgi:hypothetical protein